MAKANGLISLRGKIGDYQFYMLRGKNVVRMAPQISKERFKTDDSYKRLRENGSEFGACSRTGKELRYALQPLLRELNDTTLHYKLLSKLTEIKNSDPIAPKGERTVYNGLCTQEGKLLLRDFRFRQENDFYNVVRATITVAAQNGAVTLAAFDANTFITLPKGSTTLLLRTALVVMNAEGVITATFSKEILIDPATILQEFVLVPEANDAEGIRMLFVLYGFGTSINGEFYKVMAGKWGLDCLGVI